MNFLDFKNFDDFKAKTDMQGTETIMLLLNEIEKKKSELACQKRGKNDG